tara:strand:+ start:1354 stop:1566 length:213 start_codon:yes stop_codon:yes gene_type:complete
MYLNQELVDNAYEAAIFNLALGVGVEALTEVQLNSALEDDLETAQGISLGILAWGLAGNFNCNLKNELYE